VFWIRGDALNVADEVAGWRSFEPDRKSYRIRLQEASGIQRPAGATSWSDFGVSGLDGVLRVLVEASDGRSTEAFLSDGYSRIYYGPTLLHPTSLTKGFLVENRSLGWNPYGRSTQRRAARADSSQYVVTSEAAGAGETTLQFEVSNLLPGEYLVIGEGTDTPEVVQVMATAETGTGNSTRTEATLITPLRYDHGPGTLAERVIVGELEQPAPPLLKPHRSEEPPTRLVWAVLPTALASSTDLQVATDTTSGSLAFVIDESELTETRFDIDPDFFELGVEYSWRTRSTNALGQGRWSAWQSFTPTIAVASESEILPQEVSLGSPFPNPATSFIRVPFALPELGLVHLGVYDALGREVARLVDGVHPAGQTHVALDASSLPAGIYLVRLEAGGETRVQRLTVVR
jgi:hypothetical protein